MTPYKNLSGNSGVVEYDPGPNYIKVRFRGSSAIYVYDHVCPGAYHVEDMKKLAAAGRGLATYIGQNIKKNFSRIE